ATRCVGASRLPTGTYGPIVVVTNETNLGPTGGAVWSQPSEWAARRTPEGCVICSSDGPLDVIAEFETAWATAAHHAPLPGYVCVVARGHYNEPFEMPADEQASFWRDVMAIAAAVNEVVQPIKMNYEIHGNTLPHLHVHLFPRQTDDPFVGGPIDPRRASFVRTDDELGELTRAIRSARPGTPASSRPPDD
ncbi:MAG TPA: HIT family protein, partial [Ilumatobacteraceae bacterium]|nr:HIT family protein [Ilumatobacteraceae bacterium]